MKEPQAPLTTQDVMDLLYRRYTDKPGEHVILFDVPDVVGIGSRRRCDCIVVGMWESSGRRIEGFEIKVSRSDWLRELRDVSKADPFIERCDRWWLVTADKAIAKPEEVPHCWGWLAATPGGLRVMKPAEKLPEDGNGIMKRTFAYALLRCAGGARGADHPTVKAQMAGIYAKHQRDLEQAREEARRSVAPAHAKLLARVEKFEKDSGMKIDDWRLGDIGETARAVANLHGLKARERLEQEARSLADAAERLQAVLDSLPPAEDGQKPA